MDFNVYTNIDAVNQSFLKRMFGSINEIKKKKVNHGMVIGDGVDTLMFNPDLFQDKFTVYQGKLPTGNPSLIIEKGFEDNINFDGLIQVVRELGLYPKNYDETVIKKLEPFREYYEMIANGTRIISEDDMKVISQTMFNLHNSYTKDVVNFLNRFGNTQKVLLGYLSKVKVKGLSDWYYENRGSDKMVGGITIPNNHLLIADLKVGSFNPEKVESFVMKWNIGFQLTFYSMIAEQMTGLKPCNPVVVYANPKCPYTSYYQFPNELVEESKEKIREALDIYKEYGGDYSVHYKVKRNNGLIKTKIWE